MFVKVAYPPMIEAIDAAFNVKGKPILFAWGDTIYNPMGVRIAPDLMPHEAVHGARQGRDVVAWWERYIEDPKFRFDEELPAHVAQYRWCLQNTPAAHHRMALIRISQAIASPLYGSLIAAADARKLLKESIA